MNVFRQQYTDRKGQTKLSKKWYCEFNDHLDTTRRLPGFTDKEATKELGRRLVKVAALRAMGDSPSGDLAKWLETLSPSMRDRLAVWGMLDSKAVASGKPLSDHLKDFHESLIGKGTDRDSADLVKSRVQKIVDGCKFKFYSDIKPSTVVNFLSKLRSTPQREGAQGISIQTSNFYLAGIKQFCKWMVMDRRASDNPVFHLSGQNTKTDRRHDRRNLTAEQLVNLLDATTNGKTVRNLAGRDRAMLYRVAIETGLRRNELRSLKRDNFDLDSGEPSVTVNASETKNRKMAVLPIRPELVSELRQWFADRSIGPQDGLWPKLTDDTSRMLQHDLAAAGIPFVDDAGLYADFHSLRHSFVSMLAAGDVHPKLAQRLARHSDINLTLSRYSHTVLADEAKALTALPQFPSLFGHPKTNTVETLRATGTDDSAPRLGNVLQSGLQERGSFPCISMHRDDTSTAEAESEESDPANVKKAEISQQKPGNLSLDAERTRFELVVRPKPYADLANRCFRPLSHLSGFRVVPTIILADAVDATPKPAGFIDVGSSTQSRRLEGQFRGKLVRFNCGRIFLRLGGGCRE